MKLSFNTWVYSSFPVWLPAYPLDETIRRLARIGYDGIEIGAASPHAYPAYLSKADRKEIKKVLDDNNIAVSSMLLAPGGGPGFNPCSPLAAERRSTIEHYKEVIELSHDLGGKTVMYLAGWYVFGTPRRQGWEWSLEVLKEIAGTAANYDTTIVVEPTPTDGNLVESCDQAIEMMEESGSPSVKLMFDTQHAFYRNEVASDYVYRMGNNLRHVHLSDLDRLAPGQGRGDFVGVIQALRDIDYTGYLAMEIGFNRRDVEPDLTARQAYEYTKPLLTAAMGEVTGSA